MNTSFKKFIHSIIILNLLLFNFTITAYSEDQETSDKTAEYFFYRCAGCHTIGGGNLSGPDLKPSTQWSDEDLKSGIKKMEKNTGPMTDLEIKQLVDFLKDINVNQRLSKQKQKIEEGMRAQLPPPSFEKGKMLFQGQISLTNHGPSCFTCHQFAGEGGSLGPDLTMIKERASGIVLQSSIENSKYKIMRAIYEKHKITAEESQHLAEFLSHPEKVNKRFAPTVILVKVLASISFIVFFCLMWILNKRRKGQTRKNLVLKNRKR